MKIVLKYTISIVLTLTYLVASVGIGVHKCSAAGTKSVLFFFSDNSCESLHNHCCCGSHDCHNIKHSKKCCETEFHHLGCDYELSQSNLLSQLIYQSLTANLYSTDFSDCDLLMENYNGSIILYYDHPPSLKHSTYSYHSQWRL